MESIMLIVLTGLLATSVLTGTLVFLDLHKYAESDYFWPLSGLLTGDKKNARRLGLISHIVAGLFFTFVYLAIWSIFQPETPATFILLGAATGIAHGIIVGVGLIPILFDQGNTGFRVGVAQAVAHMAFGLVVGFCAAAMESTSGTLGKVSEVVRSSFPFAGL